MWKKSVKPETLAHTATHTHTHRPKFNYPHCLDFTDVFNLKRSLNWNTWTFRFVSLKQVTAHSWFDTWFLFHDEEAKRAQRIWGFFHRLAVAGPLLFWRFFGKEKKGIFNDKWPDRRSCRAPAIHQTADCQWTSVCCDAERLACTRTKWIMIGGTRVPGRATATWGNGPGAFVAQPSAGLWMRQMATAWQLQNVYSCDHKPTRLSNKAGKWIISRPLFKALVFVWWGLPWKWNLHVLYPHVSRMWPNSLACLVVWLAFWWYHMTMLYRETS
jgi:hypothetical protein